jgi:hypothetical protein
LLEQPAVTEKSDVFITFLETGEEYKKPLQKNVIRLGSLKGKIDIPDDFNEPLDDFKDYM